MMIQANRYTKLIFTAVLIIISVNLYSQSLDDTLQIKELVFKSVRPLSVTGKTTSLIDSSVLKHRVSMSLSEVMMENSPLFIKSYGRGAMASASFRGTAPSHTIVSWNGLELNSPMLGMVDFSQIPTFFIDEINLVHGNGSLSETPGALGGIVDMNTKTEWNNRLSGSIFQGIGSYGSLDDYVRINLGDSKVQSSTRLFFNHSDNDFSYRNKHIIDSVNYETGKKYHPVDINEGADYTNKGVLQQLSWRKSNHEVLDINVWLQESERGLPGIQSNESRDVMINRQHDKFFRTSAKYGYFGDKISLHYFNGINYNRLSYISENKTAPEGDHVQLNSQSEVLSMENEAIINLDVSPKDELELKLRYLIHSVNSYESIYGNGYDTQRGELTAGINWRRKWSSKVRTYAGIGDQWAGSKEIPWVFTAGGEYHILSRDELYMQFGVSQNVRIPTLNDLYFQPGGNPGLKPETSKSGELGLVFKKENSGRSLNTSMMFYRANVDNWIIWLPGFKGYWEPFNIKMVKTLGYEFTLETSGKLEELYYRLRGVYAYTRSLNYGDKINWADQSVGKQLPYIPLHSGNINVYGSMRGYFLLYTWIYYSERYTTNSNERSSLRDYLYPYFMNQWRMGKKIQAGKLTFDVSLAIYNLLDEEYRSVLQRPMPGRNYNLMLKMSF